MPKVDRFKKFKDNLKINGWTEYWRDNTWTVHKIRHKQNSISNSPFKSGCFMECSGREISKTEYSDGTPVSEFEKYERCPKCFK